MRPREIASFSVSTSVMRTVTEKVSSSRIMTSAAEAPLFFARWITCCVMSWSEWATCVMELLLFVGSADGDFTNLDGGKSHTNRNRLAFLAADSDALVQLQDS